MRPPAFLSSWVMMIHIHIFTYFALSIVLLASGISYSDHCSSFVPEAVPDINSDSMDTFPFSPYHVGYHTGNLSNILGAPLPSPSFANNYSSGSSSNELYFKARDVQKTDREGILKVEADLTVRFSMYEYILEADAAGARLSSSGYRRSSHRKRIPTLFLFRLEGFWSEPSQKLCMVGSTFSVDRYDSLDLEAILKMENVGKGANITSLFTGTLESLSSSGSDDIKHRFDPISLLMFPRSNYRYTIGDEPGSRNSLAGLSIPDGRFCRFIREYGSSVVLKYAANCSDPANNCTPLGRSNYGNSDSLPRLMSLNVLDCLEGERKLRVLLHFSSVWTSMSFFDPNMTLVGEGHWVERQKLIRMVACRIQTDEGSFSSARIADCSVGLTLSFPSTWSIRERNYMTGEIRSKKGTGELGFFIPTCIRDSVPHDSGLRRLKYNYTETERLKRLCPAKMQHGSGDERKQRIYPDRFSRDFTFDMSVQTSGRKQLGWGYAYPIFVENRAYERFAEVKLVPVMSTRDDRANKTNSSADKRFNIAYQMSLSVRDQDFNVSAVSHRSIDISAEGVYDPETGGLCMVGCRSLETPDSVDCEILIDLRFPPLNSKKAGDTIKGSIQSTRKILDPLRFEALDISALASYTETVASSMWRIDLEVSLVLISNTFSCIFAGSQILYVRKHPQVLPFASILMLVILALGPAVPLVLNFEAFFLESRPRETIYLESGRWIEAHEVLVRVVTLAALLFHCRLLQLSLSSRRGEATNDRRNKNSLWSNPEMKGALLLLPLYALGAFAALLINWTSTGPENYYSMWRMLKRYGGLVLDGFLLPQILLNIFRGSEEAVLTVPFYAGTTLVRLVPHGYDLWRVRNFNEMRFYRSYVYGVPETDFYSTAWDVIIPLGGVIFAAVIYLQQRFGGRCIVPRRFQKKSVDYEKVPEAGDTA